MVKSKMEYLGNCPKCKHHTVVQTPRIIKKPEERHPQREAKCINCGNLARITLIGEVTHVAGTPLSPNPEYATVNRLVFKLWD
jgi:transcription elongation factor Elf1